MKKVSPGQNRRVKIKGEIVTLKNYTFFCFLFSIFTYFQNIVSLSNIEFIKNHSKDLPYQVEENQFINREYNNEFYNSNMSYNLVNYDTNNTFKNVIVPFTVDWRKENVVSTVKNQLKCGGCWAFSSAEAVESVWAINNKQGLLSLMFSSVIMVIMVVKVGLCYMDFNML